MLIQEEKFVFINVYLPNTEKEQLIFFKDLYKVMHKEQVTSLNNIIKRGDWNLIQNFALDKAGGINTRKEKSLEKFEKFKKILCLNDTWIMEKKLHKAVYMATKDSINSMSLGLFPYL